MSKFKQLRRLSGVSVYVPEKGPYMKYVPTFSFGKNEVQAHWSHGQPIRINGGKSIIINRHFYVPDEMLGKTIVTRVEVIEKTTDDNRKFLLINFYPEDKPVKREAKFVQISDPTPEDASHFFPVSENSRCGIYFHPL